MPRASQFCTFTPLAPPKNSSYFPTRNFCIFQNELANKRKSQDTTTRPPPVQPDGKVIRATFFALASRSFPRAIKERRKEKEKKKEIRNEAILQADKWLYLTILHSSASLPACDTSTQIYQHRLPKCIIKQKRVCISIFALDATPEGGNPSDGRV